MDALLQDFKNAIQKLEEILVAEKNDITRDSAIKRFEICFDLAWKTIKVRARTEGVECYSPRECIKTAFQLKIIDHDERWLSMIEDRNKTTHLYSSDTAEDVYQNLTGYLALYQKLFAALSPK